MGLFDSLNVGLSGLRVHQFALDVTGDNITNVATPGFSRRRVALSAATPMNLFPVGQLGRGVAAGPAEAIRSRFLEVRHRLEASVAEGDKARYELLAGVEAAFSEDAGFGFRQELDALFAAFSELAIRPESGVHRDEVLNRAQVLIDQMQSAYRQMDDIAREIDRDLVGIVGQVNEKLERIAELNEEIRRNEVIGPANAERDERERVLLELSELIEVASYENEDGTITVTLRDGSPLVVADQVNALSASPLAPGAPVSIVLGSTDVTGLVGSGRVGGMLQVRDQDLPAFRLSIDTVAFEISQQFNAVHQAGFALDGVTSGLDFFVPFVPVTPGDPTGATMAMAIDPTVSGDPNLIAAAGAPASAGDGDQAQAIADLSQALVLNGGTATFSQFYAGFVFDVGSTVDRARAEADASAAVAAHVEAQKLSVSAVSLDEEAVALIQYQRGYQASARFIQAVDELTRIVMTIGA
jgi:flagellar hook-associated protein 1 FlgK